MGQELTYKNIAIVGFGAAGGFAAVLACKNPLLKITVFDEKEPFSTLLPTGGGRCNLTYDENDIKEFVKNYPRGEKFLLSVFSKLNQSKTRELFKDLGIKTYVQKDKRVFPVSDSSKILINDLKKHLNNVNHIKENVTAIKNENGAFIVSTKKSTYSFDAVILTAGGKGNGFELAKSLGHNIIETKPSLSALNIKESYLYNLAGLSFKDTEISIRLGKKKFPVCTGDILFTHNSISGPCIFKVSALTAFEDFSENNPLEITLKLVDVTKEEIEEYILKNIKKTIKNVFCNYAPESYINEILKSNNIDGTKQISQIKKAEKEILINSLISLKLNVTGRKQGSEIVTAGGVDLNEVNSKTMESKLVKGLYFAGEILNIDGFTGGFNLQSCWSTAFVAISDFNQ
jgi:hypothetical protein